MSRIANNPLPLPQAVELSQQGAMVKIKGSKGSLELNLPEGISVENDDGVINVKATDAKNHALQGTIRALLGNMVKGVTDGFERKLELRGVGYRAQMQGQQLNLSLGLSHPVEFIAPDGITIETPSQTEVVVRGIDKQQVGQVAANIRAYRPPEPYKGKGVRYAGERVIMKEAKKA
jgi:large subunit ribosomal protein L6